MILPRELWGESTRREFNRCVEGLIGKCGGLDGLALRMREAGLHGALQSWTLERVHEPISSEQLHRVFGTGELRALAAKLGMQPREFVRRLSTVLPGTVARLAAEARPATAGRDPHSAR